MMGFIQQLGGRGLNFFERLGKSALFLLRVITQCPRQQFVWSLLTEQLYRVGVLSLAIILLSALFIGMVIALQGYHTLQKFGATQELGQLIALSVVRELGPVITALLFAGRAGSALAAEIGLMQATAQLSCMEMMAVNPLWRVIAPRFWAGMISLPILTLLFNVTAIYGGQLVGVSWLGLDHGSFWVNMQSTVSFRADIFNGIVKSIVFGWVVTWIAVYQGYYATPNALGIGRATTKTVVYASLLILALDFVLTAIMMGDW